MVISRASTPKQLEGGKMRKKIAMRKGGKVAKFADGGRVFNYEDMLADSGVPGFERRAAPATRRPSRPSLITNTPAGRTPLPEGPPGDVMLPRRTGAGEDSPEAVTQRQTARPAAPRARVSSTATRRRSREMSADELNDREMTRILNERSLEAARAGRNMYKKGGKVASKTRKK